MGTINIKGEGSHVFCVVAHYSSGSAVYWIEALWKNSLVMGMGVVSSVDLPRSCRGGSGSCFYLGERCLKFKRRE